MKTKLLTTAVTVLFLQFITAQNKNDSYYIANDIIIGNYVGIGFNLNYIIKENYSLNVGFSGNVRKPKSEPEDYAGGLNAIFSVGIEKPYDHLYNYTAGFGKLFNLNKKGTIRANISVGVGYTVIREPGNWQFADSDAWINLAENYTYAYSKTDAMSLIINSKIEFPLTKYFGLSFSPIIHLNKERTYYGVGIGTMLGKLRD